MNRLVLVGRKPLKSEIGREEVQDLADGELVGAHHQCADNFIAVAPTTDQGAVEVCARQGSEGQRRHRPPRRGQKVGHRGGVH